MATHPEPGRRPDGAEPRAVFRDVDADDAAELVAMMDATDAWPAVQAARAWVRREAEVGPGALVIDVGCGPGTFGAAARAAGAATLELDRAEAMVRAVRHRHPDAAVARAALPHLPVRSGVAQLVRIERVLQWTADPVAGLVDLWRLVAPGGRLAVTDTDWGSFAVDHPDPDAAARLTATARRWVPHPTLAPSLATRLTELGGTDVTARTDVVTFDAWDPDAPEQADGPPGLPLRTIAATGGGDPHDVDALAEHARRGTFSASLTLVTAVGRRPTPH